MGLPGGQITFGKPDTKNCDSKITYAPLINKDDWYFQVDR